VLSKKVWEEVYEGWEDTFTTWTSIEKLAEEYHLPSFGPPNDFHHLA
jgi:hypothetical protein